MKNFTKLIILPSLAGLLGYASFVIFNVPWQTAILICLWIGMMHSLGEINDLKDEIAFLRGRLAKLDDQDQFEDFT